MKLHRHPPVQSVYSVCKFQFIGQAIVQPHVILSERKRVEESVIPLQKAEENGSFDSAYGSAQNDT